MKKIILALLILTYTTLAYAIKPADNIVLDHGSTYFGHKKQPTIDEKDLVRVDKIKILNTVKPHLEQMMLDAKKDDVNLLLVSGYRSVDYQKHLFYDIAKKRGQTLEERARVSAPPLYSEHQTGTAVDFDDADHPQNLNDTFADTKSGKWLAKNANKYGFYLSFPLHNSQGVMFEPWHYRFRL